eukprot:scaffold3895_cov247-Prasinococcus_capsulatus_cf.AAC.4
MPNATLNSKRIKHSHHPRERRRPGAAQGGRLSHRWSWRRAAAAGRAPPPRRPRASPPQSPPTRPSPDPACRRAAPRRAALRRRIDQAREGASKRARPRRRWRMTTRGARPCWLALAASRALLPRRRWRRRVSATAGWSDAPRGCGCDRDRERGRVCARPARGPPRLVPPAGSGRRRGRGRRMSDAACLP